MKSQIRPSIHHLGDQILWISSEMNKGRTHFNVQLAEGLYDLFPDIVWHDEVSRYGSAFDLDFSCNMVRFDESKYVPCEIPRHPYITVQFDSSKDGSDDSSEKRVYSLDQDWKIWIMNRYAGTGLDIVDIGGRKWSLAETAYIMKHSQGHVGAVSGFCLFSACVGTKFSHVYFNSPIRETIELFPDHFISYDPLMAANGIRSYFRDPHLNIK